MSEFSKLVRNCVQAIAPYVPGKPLEEVKRELGITGAVKMASNENPLGPSPEAKEAISRVLNQLAVYPDANAFYLREALARHLGVSQDQILVGNGSDDVNKVLGETILNPGDEVIIPQPTFSQYEYVTLLMNARPVRVAGKIGLGNDLTALRTAVTQRTKLVFICNPNNPTGTIVKKTELEAFLTSLPATVLVVIDEAYGEFADDPDYPNGIDFIKAGFQNIAVYRTFSKIYGMAGLRLGYCIANPALIREMMKVKEPFNTSLVAQAAGVAALQSQEHIQRSRELVLTEKQRFYRELDRLGVEYLPTQANFILINWGCDSKAIYQYLLQNGIIVRPTHSFGLPNHIRVTFGTPPQNERFFSVFRAGLQRLK
ncbi:MAG TPA: histidinol-phosphate transaminase [Bacillota bacterium]